MIWEFDISEALQVQISKLVQLERNKLFTSLWWYNNRDSALSESATSR